MKSEQVHTMLCAHARCDDSFMMQIRSGHAYGLTGGHVLDIFCDAAAALGWREVYMTPERYCPKHSKDLGLLCNRCGFAECSCMDGPKFVARRP